MNSGVEAVETAVKLARRWGYVVKKIPDNQAKVLVAKGCFWGRTITASGACDDPYRYH
jgi:ornithine--oxo-acid transaminase